MEDYTLTDPDTGAPFPIVARYFYLSSQFKDQDRLNDTLTADNLGPFADTPEADLVLQGLVSDIEAMTIEYRMRNFIPEEAPASANCYLW